MPTHDRDEDAGKGAVEKDHGDKTGNAGLAGQLPHRTENPMVKASDSDFPEPGGNPEHSGEPEESGVRDQDRGCPEPPGRVDQDPGHKQKRNQGDKEDDPLAA